MLSEIVDVVIGTDTHRDTHTVAAVQRTGVNLATASAPTTPAGYASLLEFADGFPGPRVWALEGANSYGAGLARFLTEHGEQIIELDRPKRPARRHGAKSDPLDAVRAAREALGREHVGEPRQDGRRAVLQLRLTARRSAVDASADARRQLLAAIVTVPDVLRSRLRELPTTNAKVATCAQLRVCPRWDPLTRDTAIVLRTLARRIQHLDREADEHEHVIRDIVFGWRPDLLQLCGVGPIVAATILCAWSHPGRIRNDAAFAMLAGTAPIPASSGQTIRHRLNRSGDRQLNRAIHTIVLTRLRHDPRTRAYAERRRRENKTDREIKRCLKRYITRQLYRQLENPTTPLDTP